MGRFQNCTRSSAAEKASAFIDSLVEIVWWKLFSVDFGHALFSVEKNKRKPALCLCDIANWGWHWVILCISCVLNFKNAYLSTSTVYWYKILFFPIILGGYGHNGRRIQENIIFMRFCCFKMSKKIQKLSNEQPTHTTAKCTLTGRVQ